MSKAYEKIMISSMEDSAIKDGFKNLDGKEFYNLYKSALASQADWIVGINATRLFTVLYNQLLSVGKFKHHSLIVNREEDIEVSERKFSSRSMFRWIMASSERIKEKMKLMN